MIDPLTLGLTDIIPILNSAWEASFVNVEKNLKAIADRGWGPLNYELLNNSDIQATMTTANQEHYYSLTKTFSQDALSSSNKNNNTTALNSVSQTAGSPTISDITNPDFRQVNYNPMYLRQALMDEITFATSHNFKAGMSKLVLEYLVHHDDLAAARKTIQANKEAGNALQEKTKDLKRLTVMFDFKNIGCRIGKDSLELRKMMIENKIKEEEEIQNKKDEKMLEKKKKIDAEMLQKVEKEKMKLVAMKRKYDEVMALNLPHDKLSAKHFSTFISFKKRKG